MSELLPQCPPPNRWDLTSGQSRPLQPPDLSRLGLGLQVQLPVSSAAAAQNTQF